MALTATGTITIYLQGDGVMGAATPVASETTPATSNAPPSDSFMIVGGSTTALVFPPTSSFAYSWIDLVAPANSVNPKTLLGISNTGTVDTTGLGPWTSGWVTIPACGQCVISNAGSTETLKAFYR